MRQGDELGQVRKAKHAPDVDSVRASADVTDDPRVGPCVVRPHALRRFRWKPELHARIVQGHARIVVETAFCNSNAGNAGTSAGK